MGGKWSIILKRSREGNEWWFILMIKQSLLLLPPLYILWMKIHSHVSWLLWNAMWHYVNIVVKLTYFRFDRLRCTKTRWFSSFQLELARPNYINRKIETFERFLVMQKALVIFKHGKIVFVKVVSRFTRNIWKRSLIQRLDAISLIRAWKKFYWDHKKQSTRRHPVNISFPNN